MPSQDQTGLLRSNQRSLEEETPSLSKLEYLICHFPQLFYGSVLIFPGLNLLYSDMPMLLLSVVPTESRNIWVVCLCAVLDILGHGVIMTWIVFAIITILTFIMTFVDNVKIQILHIAYLIQFEFKYGPCKKCDTKFLMSF